VAAFAAAAAIRARDSLADITLIGEERDGLYSRPGLAYLLNNEIPEEQLFQLTAGDLRHLHAKRIHDRVVRIDPEAHTVTLHNETTLSYTRLLLATGALAVRLNLPGAQLPGVFKLDNLEDARRLIKHARRGGRAVVIGGGITALELAEGLLGRGMQTHYLMRAGRYWSGVLDPSESDIIEQRLAAEGLHIHPFTQISEIMGRERVNAVRTSTGDVIRCDLLAVAIGIQPRKELAVAAGLQVDRGILVDENMQTSAPDIYAAGDVAQVYDPASGQALLDSLWGSARRQGTIAGYNMACHPMAGSAGDQYQAYHKPVPYNITRLAGLPVTIIGTVGHGEDMDLPGIARGDSETWRFQREAVPTFTQYEVNRLRVMVGARTLLGAVVFGSQEPTELLKRLIGEQVDITPIRQQLLEPNAPIAAILADFARSLTPPTDMEGVNPT
jgi:NAD(P)H-nitrite reductase large subunit